MPVPQVGCVNINAPVQHGIYTPTTVPRSVYDIGVHEHHRCFLLIRAQWPRERLAIRVHNQGAPEEGRSARLADLVGHQDIQLVEVGLHDNTIDLPNPTRRIRGSIEAEHPCGGHSNHLTAPNGKNAKSLGEPQVVAHGHAQPNPEQINQGQSAIAGAEDTLLASEQVKFSVDVYDRAIGINDHRRVKKGISYPLGKTCDDCCSFLGSHRHPR